MEVPPDSIHSDVQRSVHSLILWLVPSTVAQASQELGARYHVHFEEPSTSAAPGAGPSGHHVDTDDPFIISTPAQLSNQVSNYYINFTIYFLTNLIKEGFSSPSTENFDLQGSDASEEGLQEGDNGPDSSPAPNSGPSTPTHQPRRAHKKAGTRLATSDEDDVLRFYEVAGEKRLCTFCL